MMRICIPKRPHTVPRTVPTGLQDGRRMISESVNPARAKHRFDAAVCPACKETQDQDATVTDL